MSKQKFKKGFTLIELMVVIAIIAFLSSVVLASLRDARDRANVLKFKAEMNQLIKAIEIYKTDTGNYPYEITNSITTNNFNSTTRNNGIETSSDTPSLTTLLSKYIQKLPTLSPIENTTTLTWAYYTNTDRNKTIYYCGNQTYTNRNDSRIPKYIIITTNESKINKCI